jgi:hypothetical protein
MFLDSILGLPGQLLNSVTQIVTQPLQVFGGVANNVTNTAGSVLNNATNTVGNAVNNATSTVTDLFNSPVLLIGGAVVLLIILKK